MADQPQAGYIYTRYQAPGTTLVSDSPVVIARGIKQNILAGTLDFYDSTTTSGTAATNLLLTLGTSTTMEAGAVSTKVFDMQTRKGLVVVATGTLDYLVAIS